MGHEETCRGYEMFIILMGMIILRDIKCQNLLNGAL